MILCKSILIGQLQNNKIKISKTRNDLVKNNALIEWIRTIAVARILMPKSYIRLSAGRKIYHIPIKHLLLWLVQTLYFLVTNAERLIIQDTPSGTIYTFRFKTRNITTCGKTLVINAIINEARARNVHPIITGAII